MPHLEVLGLRKSYGQNTVLRDVTFAVERGDCVGILGPSGSGKSTMLRCLNRLETHEGGSIRVNDVAVGADFSHGRRKRRHDLVMQRRLFGMVFQQFELFPHMSVLDNVVLGQRVVNGRAQGEAVERARRELDRVGMLAKQDAMPGSLSGGQQQRVGIARAVAMDPEILLFDEPTSALDPELVAEVLAVMRDIAKSNITMLVVTHELRFAMEAADTIMFMDGGVVVESGPPERIVAEPRQERTRQFLSRLARETASSTTP